MAALVIPAECSEAAAFERAEETRYVARQGVSLRIAVSGRAELAFQGDGDRATRTMLDNAAVFGLAQLSGGLQASVNYTIESLVERQGLVPPPESTVLEVLETWNQRRIRSSHART